MVNERDHLPIEMVQTAAIFMMALVRELNRLCSMGLRMAT